jgi:hypothetical protein
MRRFVPTNGIKAHALNAAYPSTGSARLLGGVKTVRLTFQGDVTRTDFTTKSPGRKHCASRRTCPAVLKPGFAAAKEENLATCPI